MPHSFLTTQLHRPPRSCPSALSLPPSPPPPPHSCRSLKLPPFTPPPPAPPPQSHSTQSHSSLIRYTSHAHDLRAATPSPSQHHALPPHLPHGRSATSNVIRVARNGTHTSNHRSPHRTPRLSRRRPAARSAQRRQQSVPGLRSRVQSAQSSGAGMQWREFGDSICLDLLLSVCISHKPVQHRRWDLRLGMHESDRQSASVDLVQEQLW